MDIFVDYSSIEQKGIGVKQLDPKKLYMNEYDDITRVYYKKHRINHTDPITFEKMSENTSFKYPYMWDPYTGKILESDPYGPIYFHPMNLLIYFYNNRLKTLWEEQSVDNNGRWSGWYGSGVGMGEDFEIKSRGIYPERYIFRIPIQNCYLKKGHKLSLVTMGPKLSNSDICMLDNLIVTYWSKHKLYNNIYKKIGSLYKMKCYYDLAISLSPLQMYINLNNIDIDVPSKENIMKQKNPKTYLNEYAVEVLKNMD